MDLYVFVSVLSVMYTCMLCTVLSAPAADSDSASDSASTSSTTNSALSHGTHVRNKRCSCATFLDKECVYFCHLDIIWVNTPERVVSYGLGNAPRRRRAASEPLAPRSPPRCQCFSRDDKNCRSFCGLDQSLRVTYVFSSCPSPPSILGKCVSAETAVLTQMGLFFLCFRSVCGDQRSGVHM
ncbi:endothelin-1 isoform X4 [Cynoglossus semilaevis]|uniref:endothelin-1 isoform X4 n=1 Tax=Cynoglossus semilaevis TaxID=244447 RepID=UPI0007DC8E52|nr:endothelin-1 isoform X4 [Cynoglossus semilaevis]